MILVSYFVQKLFSSSFSYGSPKAAMAKKRIGSDKLIELYKREYTNKVFVLK